MTTFKELIDPFNLPEDIRSFLWNLLFPNDNKIKDNELVPDKAVTNYHLLLFHYNKAFSSWGENELQKKKLKEYLIYTLQKGKREEYSFQRSISDNTGATTIQEEDERNSYSTDVSRLNDMSDEELVNIVFNTSFNRLVNKYENDGYSRQEAEDYFYDTLTLLLDNDNEIDLNDAMTLEIRDILDIVKVVCLNQRRQETVVLAAFKKLIPSSNTNFQRKHLNSESQTKQDALDSNNSLVSKPTSEDKNKTKNKTKSEEIFKKSMLFLDILNPLQRLVVLHTNLHCTLRFKLFLLFVTEIPIIKDPTDLDSLISELYFHISTRFWWWKNSSSKKDFIEQLHKSQSQNLTKEGIKELFDNFCSFENKIETTKKETDPYKKLLYVNFVKYYFDHYCDNEKSSQSFFDLYNILLEEKKSFFYKEYIKSDWYKKKLVITREDCEVLEERTKKKYMIHVGLYKSGKKNKS